MRAILAAIAIIIPQSVFAMNYGQALVDKAYTVNGKPYASGNPPNEWSCPGGYFDFSSWTENAGFDCSGLVSYAANLRRRYLTGDLSGATFSNTIDWNSLQQGDLLHTNGGTTAFPVEHVMIYVRRDEDNLTVIHAGSSGVVEKTWNISLIRDTWFFSPYRLKYDTTPADTTVTGVEDGMVYNNNVTANFTVTDVTDNYPCGKFYVNDVLILHDKTGSKTFSQDGSYQLRIQSEDWARNTQATSVAFTIDRSSPTAGIYDTEGNLLTGSIPATKGVMIHAGDEASGICSVSMSGPPGFTPFSQSFSTNTVQIGPFLNLSTGAYTASVTDCAGYQASSTFSVVTGNYTMAATGKDKEDEHNAGKDIDLLLSHMETFSTHRGTETGKNAENFQEAVKRLSEKRNSAKARLIREAKRADKGWEYRCAIMRVMAPVQDNSIVEALIQNLKEDNSKLRGCAAKQLGEQNGGLVVDVLIQALADNVPLVRTNAASSLGQIKNPKAITSLKKHTRDIDEITAINAIWALGEIMDASSADYLISLVSDSNETQKINIVIALSKIKSDKAVKYLRELSKSDSESETVREVALEIIQKLDKGLKPW